MKGQAFQRAMSAPAIDYFFSQIESDFGLQALESAVCSVWKHTTYYEGLKGTNLKKLRAVVRSYESRTDFKQDLEQYLEHLAEKVQQSLSDSALDRKKRIASSPLKPRSVVVTSTAFARNPDVIAEVLVRASGICERCESAAPFTRKTDGSPYLEVHHIVRLADGGDDTVDNARALCPNCHREVHHGA